eukprot:m.48256 g.48256  ORF g.48256 m.48256 type:complete len:373 (-) comp10560_c1_seq2:94-1212(-)
MCHRLMLVIWVLVVPAHSAPPPPPVPHPPFDGVVRPDSDGSMVAYMIPPYLSNHASTLEKLPDGTLVAAWFSGEKEEASGCAIVFSRLLPNSKGWTAAATLSKRDNYSNQNPVLFYDNTTSILHLFHSQAPAMSGESKAQIWHLQSNTSGETWTKPQPYFTEAGDFPRNRIIRRADGTILFPFYSQGEGHPNDSVMAVSQGKSIAGAGDWKEYEVAGSNDLVQPTVVRNPKDESELVVFFRDRKAEHIYRATSHDEGKTWSTPKATKLPNNNAGIEAFPLKSSKQIIIAFNPQTSGRDPLAVALSDDGGETFPKQRLVQHGNSPAVPMFHNSNEFSYPTILQTDDGVVHMMYTYDRLTIKYKSFNVSWVTSS